MVSKLYKKQLIELSNNPYNFGKPDEIFSKKETFNKLCGDKITVYQKGDPLTSIELWFESVSCIICSASASLLTKNTEGMELNNCIDFIRNVETAIKNGTLLDHKFAENLNCLDEIKNYPSRTTCATLPWSTANELLK